MTSNSEWKLKEEFIKEKILENDLPDSFHRSFNDNITKIFIVIEHIDSKINKDIKENKLTRLIIDENLFNVRHWMNSIHDYIASIRCPSSDKFISTRDFILLVTKSDVDESGIVYNPSQSLCATLFNNNKVVMTYMLISIRKMLNKLYKYLGLHKVLKHIKGTIEGQRAIAALKLKLGIDYSVPYEKIPFLLDHQLYLTHSYLRERITSSNGTSNKRNRSVAYLVDRNLYPSHF